MLKFAGLLSLILASTVLATPVARSAGQPIYFDYSNSCLTVQNSVIAAGTPVQINDCWKNQAQLWIINQGNTKIQLAGTNFCLDAGPVPSNGAQPTISNCQDNLPEQNWYYANNYIELEGRGICIDRGNTIYASDWRVQTWTCSYTDSNQVWNL